MIKVNRRLGRNVFWSMLLFAIFSFTLFNGTAFCEEAAESLAKSLMRNADVFRAAGDLDKAREVYRRVLADWPESDEAMPAEVELIVLDIKARDYSGIDTFLSRHSGEDISHPIYKLACECTYNGNDVKAVSLFRNFLEKWPDNEQAMLVHKELISADLRKGATADIDTRVANFLSTYAGHRFLPDAVYTLGNDCENVNADNAADSLYNYVINNWPESEQAMRARHRIFKADIDNNNFANLDAYIDRIVKDHATDEDFVDRVLSICNLFIRKNDPAMALPYINRALQASPNHDKVTLLLKAKAECYIGMGANEQAVVVIDRIVKDHATDEDFVDIVLSICNLFIRKNDPAMALPYINRALEVTTELKQSIMLLKLKAMCYIDMGAEEQAKAVQEEIALYAEQEYYPGVQLAIADRYRKNGEYEKGIELYQEVIDSNSIETQQLYAYAGIGMSSVWLGDDPNATAALEIIGGDFSDNEKYGWAVFVIGEEYYRYAKKYRGVFDFINANKYYRKSISVWAKNIENKANKRFYAEAYFYTASAYYHMMEFEKAVDYYQMLLDKMPDSNRAWFSQLRIAACWDQMYKRKQLSASEAKNLVLEACKDFDTKYPKKAGKVKGIKSLVAKYSKY